MKKVTVLMPTYNVAPFVGEAVESVLRQHFDDFDLLVVDDASTDGTLDIVRTFRDPRLRIEAFDKNVGLAENLNRGLALIDTELAARMDGDDIALPQWLEREVEVLDRNPDFGICSTGFQRFGARNEQVRFPENPADCLANMLFECSVAVPTFRMSLFREHGLRYCTDAFPAEDYRFWAECLRVTKMYNLQETLFRYRMHPRQICAVRREEQLHKVSEVQRYMLEWLSDDFDEGEKRYFTGSFLAPHLTDDHDFALRKDFAQRMIELNRRLRHFDEGALRRRLDKHLVLTAYNTALAGYFANGYSIPKYLRYLSGGLALRSGFHYESRFLMKSLLHRKQ